MFSLHEAAQILRKNNDKVKKLLHDLVNKGWLKRIERGKYFLIPLSADATTPYTENQFLIASKLAEPYYIGFWSMLHHYGYTEQMLNTVFIGSPKRKRGFSLIGVNYKFVKVSPRKMFGLTEIGVSGMTITVSDKEKTFLDCLDHPEYCGGVAEAAKGIWRAREEIDFPRVLDYGKRMGNSAVAKRFGYLLEVLELDRKRETEVLREMVAKGYSRLDPLLPSTGRYNSRWNLLVNVSNEELASVKRV